MTPERWQRVREMFEAAVELEAAERSAWLETATEDTELCAEVERLLAADAAADGFLAEPAWAGPVAGRRIGPYRIGREIGRGGMGTVYLAERADGLFSKRVAVKLVRQGFGTAEVLDRFHREREILGRLEHPGIARLLDAGATADGLPYLVMEHVEGLRLDRWCEIHRPSITERLRLVLEVCAAVHHAHQNLVAHRDLKPGNILVDAERRPRLLDFGIAKLLADDGPADLTRAERQPMTLGYASPEQVRGEMVTTASDVYCLGVLLYELLAGRHPYDLAGLPPREAERVVCDEDPVPPSRAAADPRLRRRLAGDLDGIVLQALHREPGRRYASVDQLAEDLRRHLAGLPVLARGDRFWYRTGRLLRRHKGAAAFLLVVLAFGVGMGVLAFQRARALSRADRSALQASRTAELLVEMFRLSDPRGAAGETITAREILRRGTERVETELAGELEIQGALLTAIGRASLNLGLARDAAPILKRGLAARRQALGERHPDVAESLDDLARALRDTGDYAAAKPLAERGLALRRELLGRSHPDVARSLNNLGRLLGEMGDYPGAEAALAEAVAIRRQAPGDPRAWLGDSLSNLAALHRAQGRYDRAEPLLREALALYRQKLGDNHPNVATGLNNLALTLHRRGDSAAAEPLLREALALHRRALGNDHPDAAATLENLAGLLGERGDFTAAEPLFREALALHRRRLGGSHPTVALGLNNLASLLHAKGDLQEAELRFREALALRRALLPPDHPETASSLVGLGAVLVDRGRAVQAEPLLREGLATRRGALPAHHWRTAVAEAELGGCLLALGRSGEARRLLTGSVPVLDASLGAAHRQTRRAAASLGALTATSR